MRDTDAYMLEIDHLTEKAFDEMIAIKDQVDELLTEIERRKKYGGMYPGWQSKHRSAAYRKSLDLSDTLVELRKALYTKEKQ